MSRKQAVLSSYRSLLRATRIAFDKDVRLLTNSRLNARLQYDAGRAELSTDDFEEIDKRLEHAAGVALILRTNVVQGQLQNSSETDSEESVYKLRIHKYTELGENESVKGGKSVLSGTQRRVKWQ